MIELLAYTLTLMAVGVLAAPVVRRLAAPTWYRLARERGRPGIPVLAVGGALVLTGILWLIGERRGVFGAILLILWFGAPLTAFFVVRAWLTDRRNRRGHRGQ